jgi:hypothetical protein
MMINIDKYFQGQLKHTTLAPDFPTDFRLIWTHIKIVGKDKVVRVSSCLN